MLRDIWGQKLEQSSNNKYKHTFIFTLQLHLSTLICLHTHTKDPKVTWPPQVARYIHSNPEILFSLHELIYSFMFSTMRWCNQKVIFRDFLFWYQQWNSQKTWVVWCKGEWMASYSPPEIIKFILLSFIWKL